MPTSSSGPRAATIAGHTVVNPRGKFALHLVPAGIFNDQTRCLIGPGVALNPETLLSEMDELARRGVSTDNLVISARAHLVMPYHPIFDRLEEQARGEGAIGTTGRGIGPTYADKVARSGIVAGDLLHLDRLRHEGQDESSPARISCWSGSTAPRRSIADAIIERYRSTPSASAS